MQDIKVQFPFFAQNSDIVYLDSAATTQKPKTVIDALNDFYANQNANAGRSSYPLANNLTKQVEHVRSQVQNFINAEKPEEIIFTSGATDSFNKIIYSLAFNYLQDGDEVLFCPGDHKSFVLPWFQVKHLLQRHGITIHLIPFKTNEYGSIDRNDLFAKITPKTKVINATHVHNIYGSDSDIDKIRQHINDRDIIINVDASQSIGHMNVDVQQLGADILSFSGHKMFASQGTGVTYIHEHLHKKLLPVFIGGGNGVKLQHDQLEIYDLNQAYEAGTQNFAGIISLGKAIEFIDSIGIQSIHSHLSELTQYLLHQLRQLNQIEFTAGPHFWPCADGLGILSFRINNLSAAEVGFILSENNIFVRTGDHCTTDSDNIDDSIRVSMHIYNTKQDVDRLVEVLKSISG